MGLLPINLLIDLRKPNFLSDIWSHIDEVKAMCSLHHLAKWTDRDFNSWLKFLPQKLILTFFVHLSTYIA